MVDHVLPLDRPRLDRLTARSRSVLLEDTLSSGEDIRVATHREEVVRTSDALARDGFVCVENAIAEPVVSQLDALLETTLTSPTLRASRNVEGRIFGSRHLLDDAPELCRVALRAVTPTIRPLMEDDTGLVRALFFDKTPGDSWALPWHRDRVIAVRGEDGTSSPGGVSLVDAGDALLARMLGVRIHLDDADEDNGALRVRPGSHVHETATDERTLCARRGDVIVMRPLLFHASSRSRSARPRRVLHLELAPLTSCPNGHAWHAHQPLSPSSL